MANLYGSTNTNQSLSGDIAAKNPLNGHLLARGLPGKDGKDGKSAYEYAKDGGYTGTEEEFTAKLAKEDSTSNKADEIVETVTGTNAIIIDSTNKPLQALKLFGKSEQNTIMGNQLIQLKPQNIKTDFGLISTINEDGSITINGTPTAKYAHGYFEYIELEPGQYYIYHERHDNMPYCQVEIVDANDSHSYITNSSFTIDGTEKDIILIIQSGALLYNISNYTIYPMLNKGATALPYESYTDNVVSPNPHYPQEITSIENIDLSVFTGNVYDPSFRIPSDGTIKSFGCNVTEKDGVFSITATRSDSYVYEVMNTGNKYDANVNGCLIAIPDGVKRIYINVTNSLLQRHFVSYYDANAVSLGTTNHSSNVFESSVISNAKYFSLRFGKSDATVGTTYETRIMVNFASKLLPFEPYGKQSFSVLIPNGLKGIEVTDSTIANYTDVDGKMWCCDEMDFKRGKYVQRIASTTLPKDFWYFEQTTETFIEYVRYGFIVGQKKQLAYSEYFGQELNNRISVIESAAYVRFPTAMFVTTEEVEEWLATHDVNILYILETPIETDLTEEQIEQYKALTTNYPNTTFISDAFTSADYVADTKKYIDKKFAELASALV